MSFRFRDLWSWKGTIGRGAYAVVGLLGFAIKHNLDRFLAASFGRPWSLFNYWIPLNRAVKVWELSAQDAKLLATMVTLALPFIWVGVVLTLKRLRSAGLPVWLVVLFFAPMANLAFFALLCIFPSRSGAGMSTVSAGKPRPKHLGHLIPQSAVGSAVVAVLLTAAFVLGMTALSTNLLKDYGWGLFVALPFCLGLGSVLLYGYHAPRSFGSCMMVCMLAVSVVAASLLAFAIEGLLCILMAAPLALALALMGGILGYEIQLYSRNHVDSRVTLSIVLLLVPGVLGAERATAPAPTIYSVRTTIEIAAPPERVWNEVVAFAQIPEPQELLFRIGIAYPIRAEIQGTGVGSERHCIFSTGAFVEPIEVWDPPRTLKFSVTSNPPPMQEWTPYSRIEPPHLKGFLVSNGGQFLLAALPGGHTRLEGTTWYCHSLWPEFYWRIWSDQIIHQIHLRVLRHIERQTLAHAGLSRQEAAP